MRQMGRLPSQWSSLMHSLSWLPQTVLGPSMMQDDVQHGSTVQSHCSPASWIPLPHTGGGRGGVGRVVELVVVVVAMTTTPTGATRGGPCQTATGVPPGPTLKMPSLAATKRVPSGV